MIRDHISKIDADKETILDSSMTQTQVTQSNLQRSIEWIFQRKQFSNPSKWHNNDDVLNILYDVITAMELHKFSTITVDDKNNVNVGGSSFTPEKGTIILDLLPFLVRQGYLRQDSEIQYTILGNFPKFHTDVSGIFVKDQQVFLEAYENFKEKIIHFVGMKTKWFDDIGITFDIDDFEPKLPEIKNQMSPYLDLGTFNTAHDFYVKLKQRNPPLIPIEQLHQETTNLNSISDLLQRPYFALLSQIFVKQLKMQIVSNNNDISKGIFAGLPNRNLPNTTLHFQVPDKKIDRVGIALSPPVDFIMDVNDHGLPSNNIIFILGDESQFSSYRSNWKITSAPTPLEEGIRSFSNISDDENKTIFYALELPIQFDKLEKIIQYLKKIPIK